MIYKALITAAAVAGLFSSSIVAQAGTCPFTGATSESSKGEGDKKESKDASKESDKAKDGAAKDSAGCSGCPAGAAASAGSAKK